jgi:hypothetical protein
MRDPISNSAVCSMRCAFIVTPKSTSSPIRSPPVHSPIGRDIYFAPGEYPPDAPRGAVWSRMNSLLSLSRRAGIQRCGACRRRDGDAHHNVHLWRDQISGVGDSAVWVPTYEHSCRIVRPSFSSSRLDPNTTEVSRSERHGGLEQEHPPIRWCRRPWRTWPCIRAPCLYSIAGGRRVLLKTQR